MNTWRWYVKAGLVMALSGSALGAARAPVAIFDEAVKAAGLAKGPNDRAVSRPRARLGAKATAADVKAAFSEVFAGGTGANPVLLSDQDQEYWALRSFFSGNIEGFRFRQTGAWFERRGKRWFVRAALPGSPAADAGLKRGDEIVSVDGVPLAPVASFSRLRPTVKARVTYKRLAYEKSATVDVATRVESVQETLLRAMQTSRHLYDLDKVKIGYVWLPAATNPAFKDELTEAVAAFQKDADALVLDLRDAFGGADLTYLEPFFALDGHDAAYTKPLVVLIDAETRSGRERLAWMLKRQKRATLVGEATAGDYAVTTVRDVAGGDYLVALASTAVDAKLPAETVMPDVPVERGLMYTAGADEQLSTALKAAVGAAKR